MQSAAYPGGAGGCAQASKLSPKQIDFAGQFIGFSGPLYELDRLRFTFWWRTILSANISSRSYNIIAQEVSQKGGICIEILD